MADCFSPEARLAGAAARDALDRVLAEQPERDGADFAVSLRALCACRDAVIAACREQGRIDERADTLLRLNAVISVVLGGQFPLGAVPWRHVAMARAALAGLLGEGQGG